MKRNYLVILTVFVLSVFACQEESDEQRDGIVPKSIDQIVDIFELKYGEEKEWFFENRVFKFIITDIEDNLLNCTLGYILPEKRESIKISAILRIEIDELPIQLKVSSRVCGGLRYINDGRDEIQDLWDIFNEIQITASKLKNGYFSQEFVYFGKGALINKTLLSIFMGKHFPELYGTDKNSYKFIFIITNSKR